MSWIGFLTTIENYNILISIGAENGWTSKKINRTFCLPSNSLGLGNTQNMSYCPIVGKFFSSQMVFNSSVIGHCCVQLSNGWSGDCPTFQWSDSAVSNCSMVGRAVSNSPYLRILNSDILQYQSLFHAKSCYISLFLSDSFGLEILFYWTVLNFMHPC